MAAAWRALAAVEDPEIPALSIVDLGLVRGVEIQADDALHVRLSPTYTGCPATEIIRRAVEQALAKVEAGRIVVTPVLAPAWTSDWITAEGRAKLAAYGIVPPRRVASTRATACATMRRSRVRAAARCIRHASVSSVPRRARPCTGVPTAWNRSKFSSAFDGPRMPTFHALKVVAVERIAEDAVSLTLAVPDALRDQFKFAAGQYVPIRRIVDGREEQRTYSIVAAPGGAGLRLGVRVQPHGRVSGDLAQGLQAGDLLDVGRRSADSARASTLRARAPTSRSPPAAASRRCFRSRRTSSRGNRSAGSP